MNLRGPRRKLGLTLSALGVVVLLLGLGVVIGRATAPGPPRAQTAPPVSGTPSGTPTSSDPGPTRTVNGVPLGYAHTQAGALAAATYFERTLAALTITPEALRSAVTTLAAPDERDALVRRFEALSDTLNTQLHLTSGAARGLPTVVIAFPLTCHLEHYDDSAAQVSVWLVGVFAQRDVLTPTSTWGTDLVSLRWVGGDWRLVGDTLDNSVPSVVPAVLGVTSTDTAIPPQLTSFGGYRYVPAP